mgnify:CR=1 FL=1
MNRDTSGLREHLGIRYAGMDNGAVVLELDIAAEHLNVSDALHGGAIATLVDIACALAARTPPGKEAQPVPADALRVATVSLALHFTRGVREGRVRAFGRRLSAGRRMVFANADVFDAEGRLVANGSGSYAIVG